MWLMLVEVELVGSVWEGWLCPGSGAAHCLHHAALSEGLWLDQDRAPTASPGSASQPCFVATSPCVCVVGAASSSGLGSLSLDHALIAGYGHPQAVVSISIRVVAAVGLIIVRRHAGP